MYCFEANVVSITYAKFCQNQLGFVDDVIKTLWFNSSLTIPADVRLQNANAEFDEVV